MRSTGRARDRGLAARGRVARSALFAIGVVVCALPTAAGANPAYEPNDGIHQAYGPLQANTNYDATISANNEDDWYIVYVSGQGVLNIDFTNTNQNTCCSNPTVYLLDQNGKTLNSTTADEGQTRSIPYTTPGPGHYYIEVLGGVVPDQYRLRLSGPITDGPRPGAFEVTPNASRDAATAFGPLAGDKLYGGSIDAQGEDDWFFFNTSGPGAFDVSFTNINDDQCCSSLSVYLYDSEGVATETTLNSTSVDRDIIGHLQFTAPRAEQYFLQVLGGVPVDRYQFFISPGGLLTDVTPLHATQACADAEAKLAKAKEKLVKAKAALASAFTKGAKRRAKDKVQKAKGKVKNAKGAVKTACGA